MADDTIQMDENTDYEQDWLNMPLAIHDESGVGGECSTWYKICLTDRQKYALWDLVTDGVHAKQRHYWQNQWRESGEKPDDMYVTITDEYSDAVNKLLDIEQFDGDVITPTCPALPRGTPRGSYPQPAPYPQRQFEGQFWKITFRNPPMIYGQQVIDIQSDPYFFADNFNRLNFEPLTYGWYGDIANFQISSQRLQGLVSGSKLKFPLHMQNYKLELDLVKSSGLSDGNEIWYFLNFCDNDNYVVAKIFKVSNTVRISLTQRIDGSNTNYSTVLLDYFTNNHIIAYVWKNGLSITYGINNLSIGDDFNNTATISSICPSEQVLDFQNLGWLLDSIKFKPHNATVTNDVFTESGVDLTPIILQWAYSMLEHDDINPYRMQSARLLVDYARFESVTGSPDYPYQTLPPLTTPKQPTFYPDFSSHVGTWHFPYSVDGFGTFDMTIPANSTHYAYGGRLFKFFGLDIGNPDTFFGTGIANQSVWLEYQEQVCNPVPDYVQVQTECRNGVRVFMSALSGYFWGDPDYRPSSGYSLTGDPVFGSTDWGGHYWAGGTYLPLPTEGYVAYYAFQPRRDRIWFKSCQTYAHFVIVLNLPPDPVLDLTDDDIDNPVKVPQVYDIHVSLAISNGDLIGDFSFLLVGEGEHTIEDTIALPTNNNGIRGYSTILQVYNPNTVQCFGFPHALSNVSLDSDYC